jgi:hypothetical protein
MTRAATSSSVRAAAGRVLQPPDDSGHGLRNPSGIDPGRVAAQHLLHPAEFLEDLPPIQKGQLAQAGECIATGQLLPGLPVLLTQVEGRAEGFERALEPALDRCQRRRLVVEQADQLRTEIRAGTRLRFRQFRQDRESWLASRRLAAISRFAQKSAN